MTQFLNARLKLTLWYTLIIMIISVALSGLYYRQTLRIIDFQYGRIELRLRNGDQHLMQMPTSRPRADIFRSELQNVEKQLGGQLLIINGLVLILGASASYFLSGKTLQPIHKSLLQQQQFVADAAHELRTPITAMKTALEVSLMDKKISRSSRKILEDNLQDVTSLESLSTHLLKLASSENKTKDKFSAISLNQVLSRAQKHLNPMAKKKNVTLTRFDEDQVKVLGDEDGLFEICMILLDNAIKFSPQKSQVKLKIVTYKNQAVLQITDQGPGISTKDIPHIFKHFYRVEKSRQRQSSGGYGLGLAVAKKIAKQHQARLSVTSSLGKGSTFSLTLPLISSSKLS